MAKIIRLVVLSIGATTTRDLVAEPMTPTVPVPDAIERDAAGSGSDQCVDASGLHPGPAPALTDVEFEHLLDELASGPVLPHLPADFSRADIYADHD